MKDIWECPKCKRIFKRAKQQHSCVIYPLEKHFERKEYTQKLYNYLKKAVKENVGQFRVESLPCCIHFVNKDAYTFAAVFGLKDKIRLHLASEEPSKSPRIKECTKISSKRYLYSLDVKDKDEIDADLIERIRKAFKFAN